MKEAVKNDPKLAIIVAKKCSFCGKPGHNLATCEGKRDSLLLKREQLFVFREESLDRLAILGLAPGALVKQLGNYGKKGLGIVKGIDWSRYDFGQVGNFTYVYSVRIKYNDVTYDDYDAPGYLEIVSKVPEEAARVYNYEQMSKTW